MKNSVLVLFAGLAAGTPRAATPDFSMMGFATTEGGTTGGTGGQVVTPTTYAELKAYLEDRETPMIIRVTKEFNTGIPVQVDTAGNIVTSGGIASTYGDILKPGSNKTLVGIGSEAFLNRIGLVIQTRSNIIVRNIRFTMKNVPIARTDENKVVGWVDGAAKTLSDPDCIGIQADDTATAEASRFSKHIWIDHCEFFNEDPSVMTDVDRYDGLVDGKNNVTDVTISWCHFHDHHKASLMGKGNSDDYDRRITYSHNRFQNIASRLPLIRFGKVHMLNNYMVTSENGTNARINSDVYIEGNHYQDSKKPVFGKVSEAGAATFVDNAWVNCLRVPQIVLDSGEAAGADPLSASEEVLVGTFKPSTYYAYAADAVADVPATVSAWAGVGKIGTAEYDAPVTTGMAMTGSVKGPWISAPAGTLRARASRGERLQVSDLQGRVRFSALSTGEVTTVAGLGKGVWLVSSGAQVRRVAMP